MIAVTLDEWKTKLEFPTGETVILHNPKVRPPGSSLPCSTFPLDRLELPVSCLTVPNPSLLQLIMQYQPIALQEEWASTPRRSDQDTL